MGLNAEFVLDCHVSDQTVENVFESRELLLTMSSAAARRPTAQSPLAYAAAKAGIEVLSRELATQVGPDGVRVNCIAPETILTERSQRQIPADVQEQLRGSVLV
jgi:3-oxoacyl-[acyl-carrier protein] reductase